jgi:uncharacterized iron-regulated membrane protein
MNSVKSAGLRATGKGLWFSVHKWIGLLLLLVLIPLSASGSLLVWHDWTDSLVNPQRYAVKAGPPRPAGDYVASARAVLKPQDRIASIEWPEGTSKPVVLTASPEPAAGAKPQSGPPARYQIWLDPVDARVLDHADARTGLLRTLHVFHGSLMIPGTGRQIVGWLGVLMLVSCLTGVWLWWPQTGRLLRAFRWKRGPLTSANLHHQVGIWIAIPLAVLSFTGAYISFPTFFKPIEERFSAQKSAPRAPAPDRRARPAPRTSLTPDQVIAAARKGSAAQPGMIRWPNEGKTEWAVTLGGHHQPVRLSVDDASGEVRAGDAAPGGVARFMRQLHDGHDYNFVWQTIIFLGGLAPALLGVTGLIMWLRTRGWRSDVARRQRSRRTASQPAA